MPQEVPPKPSEPRVHKPPNVIWSFAKRMVCQCCNAEQAPLGRKLLMAHQGSPENWPLSSSGVGSHGWPGKGEFGRNEVPGHSPPKLSSSMFYAQPQWGAKALLLLVIFSFGERWGRGQPGLRGLFFMNVTTAPASTVGVPFYIRKALTQAAVSKPNHMSRGYGWGSSWEPLIASGWGPDTRSVWGKNNIHARWQETMKHSVEEVQKEKAKRAKKGILLKKQKEQLSSESLPGENSVMTKTHPKQNI